MPSRPEVRIALFGMKGAGKTTLLASYFGNQQRNAFEERHGYRLEAADAAQGSVLLSRYYRLEGGDFPIGTDGFDTLRFGLKVHDLPTPIHAELVSVEVMYHPLMLRVEVSMPKKEELFPAMLTDAHQPLHNWPVLAVEQGSHTLELPLGPTVSGTYYLELATASQRTERRFIVRTI